MSAPAIILLNFLTFLFLTNFYLNSFNEGQYRFNDLMKVNIDALTVIFARH